jgi:hypothetical protein
VKRRDGKFPGNIIINFFFQDVWSIVRLVSEFSRNIHRRIQFPLNSADGLFLFRYTAQILINFGNFMNNYNVCSDRGERRGGGRG